MKKIIILKDETEKVTQLQMRLKKLIMKVSQNLKVRPKRSENRFRIFGQYLKD